MVRNSFFFANAFLLAALLQHIVGPNPTADQVCFVASAYIDPNP